MSAPNPKKENPALLPPTKFPTKFMTGFALAGLFLSATICFGQDPASTPANMANRRSPTESSSLTNKSAAKKTGAQTTPTDSSAQTEAKGSPEDVYQIGVDDELQISVWREPELTSTVVVRPDGKITLPLLNDIEVVGLRTEELQNLLTEKLKAYVNEPQVTVSARAIRSRKVYLLGQVPRPGAYLLGGRKTVLQLLAEAGGLGLFAKSGSIYILRKQNGHETRIPFDYSKAVRGRSDKEGITLLPGDMVVVP